MPTDPADDPARCIPVLASLDIQESLTFYTEQLGFSSTLYEAEQYLIVSRDEMEIHFWLTDNPEFPRNTSCYIRGGQIVTLWAEYSTRKVPGLSADFAVRPWNMAEFYVHDPHGNLIKFGAAPEEIGMA